MTCRIRPSRAYREVSQAHHGPISQQERTSRKVISKRGVVSNFCLESFYSTVFVTWHTSKLFSSLKSMYLDKATTMTTTIMKIMKIMR